MAGIDPPASVNTLRNNDKDNWDAEHSPRSPCNAFDLFSQDSEEVYATQLPHEPLTPEDPAAPGSIFLGIVGRGIRSTFLLPTICSTQPLVADLIRTVLDSNTRAGRILSKWPANHAFVSKSQMPEDVKDEGYDHISTGMMELGTLEDMLSNSQEFRGMRFRIEPAKESPSRSRAVAAFGLDETVNIYPIYILTEVREPNSSIRRSLNGWWL